jgi:hypothetical protein
MGSMCSTMVKKQHRERMEKGENREKNKRQR